jgi:hypothetical protein
MFLLTFSSEEQPEIVSVTASAWLENWRSGVPVPGSLKGPPALLPETQLAPNHIFLIVILTFATLHTVFGTSSPSLFYSYSLSSPLAIEMSRLRNKKFIVFPENTLVVKNADDATRIGSQILGNLSSYVAAGRKEYVLSTRVTSLLKLTFYLKIRIFKLRPRTVRECCKDTASR